MRQEADVRKMIGKSDSLKRKEINVRYAPVLHFLISVVSNWQVLVEAVVGGVARRVINDGSVSTKEKTSSRIYVRTSFATRVHRISQQMLSKTQAPPIFTFGQQQWRPPPLQTVSWCSLPSTSAPSAPCRPRGLGFAPRAPASALGGSSWSHLAAGTAAVMEE